MRKRIVWLLVSCLMVATPVLASCAPAVEEEEEVVTEEEVAPAPSPAPAEFEVVSLSFKPLEVTAGETVSIMTVVENSGGIEGTYAVILTVDGIIVETKEVTIAPGTSKVVAFSLVTDASGTYDIGVGELSSSLAVKEPVLVTKELKYDDGEARDFISVFPPIITGYLVDFTPPATPFTIKKVRLYGSLATWWVQENFEVEIWDKDHNVLYSGAFAVTLFTESPEANWVEVQIPDIEVVGEFYVHVHTGTGIREGIHLGADDSVANEHSDTTVKVNGTSRILDAWPYSKDYWFGDKSNVNWMIRVVGTFMEREQS